MIDWKRIRVLLERVVLGLAALAWGAWLLMAYIRHARPEIARQLDGVDDSVSLIFCLLNFACIFVRQPDNAEVRGSAELSPQWSGAGAVLLIGLVAAFALRADGANLASAIMAFLSLLAASAVWRWAKANAANIGEARFDTSHNPS